MTSRYTISNLNLRRLFGKTPWPTCRREYPPHAPKHLRRLNCAAEIKWFGSSVSLHGLTGSEKTSSLETSMFSLPTRCETLAYSSRQSTWYARSCHKDDTSMFLSVTTSLTVLPPTRSWLGYRAGVHAAWLRQCTSCRSTPLVNCAISARH